MRDSMINSDRLFSSSTTSTFFFDIIATPLKGLRTTLNLPVLFNWETGKVNTLHSPVCFDGKMVAVSLASTSGGVLEQ